jgi:predicted Zn-dependent peptidase
MREKVSKTVLDNGVRILTAEMPHMHSVSMGLWVNAGARDETPAENGLSHLIEHMVFKGTARRSALQIAKEFDAIGGNNNAFTSMETTCFHGRVMASHLPAMADILCDIFLNSVFDGSELERERPVILQEIGMLEDSPEEYVHVLLEETFWGEHPLGKNILGTPENLTRFDSAGIKDFFRRFCQPGRIVVSAAGNVTHERFVDLVGPAFESLSPTMGGSDRVPASGNRQVRVVPRDLEQVHIALATRGLSVSDPGRYACVLMNTILGGNMSSRLFQEIRERRGLAYSVYSFLSPHQGTGMCGAYAGVQAEHAHETTELMIRQMGRLKNVPVTTEELQEAKEYSKSAMLLATESVESQMAALAQNELHFGRHIPVEEILERIDAVSANDISALAAALFRSDALSLVLLGPVADGNSDFDVHLAF